MENKLFKNVLFLFTCLLLAGSLIAGTVKKANANSRYASIVVDAETGLVLHQRYADKKLHPASLTKIMTLIMVFDALDKNKISLKERVRISRRAANMIPSKIGLKPGQTISVHDAIHALVTKSANDIAVALAEHLSGSESQFAVDMTKKHGPLVCKILRSGTHPAFMTRVRSALPETWQNSPALCYIITAPIITTFQRAISTTKAKDTATITA